MLIKRRSPFSGVEHEMEIDVSEAQLRAWNRGVLIQNAMPHLTPDEREFIMTGIMPDEWDAMFKEPTSSDEQDEVWTAQITIKSKKHE